MDADWEHWKSGAVDCFIKKFDDFRGFVAKCECEFKESIVTIQSKQPKC